MSHEVTFVDVDDNPIDAMTWGRLFEEAKAAGTYILAEKVYETPVGQVIVRTAWGGLNIPGSVQPFGTGTAVSPDGPWTEVEQYTTRAEALAGHERWTSAVRQVHEGRLQS